MDEQDLNSMRRRIAALEDEVFGPRRPTSGPSDQKLMQAASARRALASGNLEAAGAALGLDRSHNGAEEDESYERRLRAHLDGAAAADAEKPRPAALAEEHDPLKDSGSDEKTVLDPGAGTGDQAANQPMATDQPKPQPDQPKQDGEHAAS